MHTLNGRPDGRRHVYFQWFGVWLMLFLVSLVKLYVSKTSALDDSFLVFNWLFLLLF